MKNAYDAEIAAPALPLARGSADRLAVIRLQEWLVVRGYKPWSTPAGAPGIDGDYGAATASAVAAFAADNGIAAVVDERFWFKLTSPMLAAFGFRPRAKALGDAIVEVAAAHVLQKPAEARAYVDGRLVGEDNSGPWCRAYLGPVPPAPWCQAFVNRVRDQAAAALGTALEVPSSMAGRFDLWVPDFVEACRKGGKFLSGRSLAGPIAPGSMFFVPGVIAGVWSHIHVGIVTAFNGETFESAEGNTNNDGSSNGWLALKRTRRTASCDFGVL